MKKDPIKLANEVLFSTLVETFRQLEELGLPRDALRQVVAYFLGYDAAKFEARPNGRGVELICMTNTMYAGAKRQRQGE